MRYRFLWLVIPLLGFAMTGYGDTSESPQGQPILKPDGMDNAGLDKLIKRLDGQAKAEEGYWEFIIEDRRVFVITDERADRMRIISPIESVEGLGEDQLYRLMQANFDSALDARYSIAKGVVWSAYIHPLSPLSDKEFLIGVGQVVNLVETYGTTYSSGALIFQGGDSQDLQRRKLIDQLLEKGLVI